MSYHIQPIRPQIVFNPSITDVRIFHITVFALLNKEFYKKKSLKSMLISNLSVALIFFPTYTYSLLSIIKSWNVGMSSPLAYVINN